jgi:hypothetical protein
MIALYHALISLLTVLRIVRNVNVAKMDRVSRETADINEFSGHNNWPKACVQNNRMRVQSSASLSK